MATRRSTLIVRNEREIEESDLITGQRNLRLIMFQLTRVSARVRDARYKIGGAKGPRNKVETIVFLERGGFRLA